MIAIGGNHAEESAVRVARTQLFDLPKKIFPRKPVGLDKTRHFLRESETTPIGNRAIEHNSQRERTQQQQRIHHRAAVAERLPRDSEFIHLDTSVLEISFSSRRSYPMVDPI